MNHTDLTTHRSLDFGNKPRLYVPGYGPDRSSLIAGMDWLLDSNVNRQLLLYVLDNSMVAKDEKILQGIYGEELCEGLRKNKVQEFRGKTIRLLTKRYLTSTPHSAKILVLYADSDDLNQIEKRLDFSELLVVSWNCCTDLLPWVQKTHAEQFMEFLPNDPRNLPDWESSSIEPDPPDVFVFKTT